MKDALEIYVKLLVAVISFIAPLLIHLISMFSDARAMKKRRWEEYSSQNEHALIEIVKSKSAGLIGVIDKNIEEFKNSKREYDLSISLLEPKRQINFIFPVFFTSLLLIILNGLACNINTDNYTSGWVILIQCLNIVFMMGSIGLAALGVQRLYAITQAVINVKEEIASYHAEEKRQLKDGKAADRSAEEKLIF